MHVTELGIGMGDRGGCVHVTELLFRGGGCIIKLIMYNNSNMISVYKKKIHMKYAATEGVAI